ncbi:MAG: hypothetical protein ABW360_03445 [Phenylobacterium sp.]
MSKTLTLVLAAAASLTALGVQAADRKDVAAAFGNTVLSTYPDGRQQKIWMKPDGSWDGLSRRGTPLAGKWSLKDEKVCLRQSKPPTLPVAYCTPFPDQAAVGVVWTGKDMSGTPITLKLVKGMPKTGS